MACSSRDSAASRPVEELSIGFPEGTGGADFGANQFASSFLTFESLTNNGPDGRAIPRLAESWAWDRDGLQLRVLLREGVLLHDGRPFEGATAANIVRAAVMSPRNQARYTAFGDITDVRAGAPRELVFDLHRPSAMLPEDLAVPLDVGKDIVGTGPYRIPGGDSKPGGSSTADVVLERFDRYYLGKPTIGRVRIHPFPVLRTAWTSLLRGDVDMVYDVPADAIEFVSNDSVSVLRQQRWYQYAIVFNSQRGALKSAGVRRALNLAVDRSSLLNRVLKGRGIASSGPVYPSYWAYDPSAPTFSFDPRQASSLLDQAGYRTLSNRDDPTRPPARLRFECLLPEDFAVWERIALEIQKNLYTIGVDMRFRVVPFEEFNRRMSTGDFDAVFLDLISGPTPGRTYMFWRSRTSFKGAYNVFGYENPEAEQAFGVLRTDVRDAATRSATARLQRTFMDDPPALFVAWNERARAIRSDFVLPSDGGREPMLSLWRWTRSGTVRRAE